jgi:hypothetical protein
VLTEGGTRETALFTEYRCARMSRRRRFALLALQDEQRTEMVQKSLSWLRQNAARVDSVSSLAWSILTLFVYQEPVARLKNRLATIIGDGRDIRNNATLATALLALKCGEMIHPFVVLR